MRSHLRLVLLPLILACSDPAVGLQDFVRAPGASPPVVTDTDVYRLTRVDGGYAAEALATYTNTADRPVYFQRCMPDLDGPMYGLRRTGPDSIAHSFVGDAWACVGGVPTGRVLPGARISARVSLGSTDSPLAQPPIAAADRVGRFRIEFALCVAYVADSDDCEPLPQAARESNAFEIRFR
jgi:hypothetical protein